MPCYVRIRREMIGEGLIAMEFDLIPQGTRLQENGHGEAVDIRASATRTFFPPC